MPDTTDVTNNPERHRFELAVDGHVAFASYRLDGDIMTLPHTVVPEALAGRGIATTLIRGALEQARVRGLRIVPECAFVAAYLRKHPEDADLIAG